MFLNCQCINMGLCQVTLLLNGSTTAQAAGLTRNKRGCRSRKQGPSHAVRPVTLRLIDLAVARPAKKSCTLSIGCNRHPRQSAVAEPAGSSGAAHSRCAKLGTSGERNQDGAGAWARTGSTVSAERRCALYAVWKGAHSPVLPRCRCARQPGSAPPTAHGHQSSALPCQDRGHQTSIFVTHVRAACSQNPNIVSFLLVPPAPCFSDPIHRTEKF